MSDSANNGNLFHRISVFVVDKISKAKIQANFFNCRSAYISARIRMFLTTLISLIKKREQDLYTAWSFFYLIFFQYITHYLTILLPSPLPSHKLGLKFKFLLIKFFSFFIEQLRDRKKEEGEKIMRKKKERLRKERQEREERDKCYLSLTLRKNTFNIATLTSIFDKIDVNIAMLTSII